MYPREKINPFLTATFKTSAILLKGAVATIVFSFTLELIATSQASANPATYFQSCTDEKILGGGNTGAVLAANCRAFGITIPAEIDLEGINNNNGNLAYSSLADGYKSTFLETCSQARIVRGVLYALCDDGQGNNKLSKLRLENIDNNLGFLLRRNSNYCCTPQTSAATTDIADIDVNNLRRLPPLPRDANQELIEQEILRRELETERIRDEL
ncbi:CVNH domain-containing protein [Calothrix sp. PCC 6303]|uniref:CVNH domain-containing protein n=1 Tax=Calothrix sp. PCC 6303 TaxID=1170562 RepID=UPI0002A00334|nr:CVNH domain-containing protein [Calothrix sp. PCC 6303]AFZ01155.1 Cyanovirin-N domain protein [Calothrix sp. PCC 6303]